MSERSGFGSFFAGFIAGAVAGAIATILYAPNSGEETREVLRIADSEDICYADNRCGYTDTPCGVITFQ